MPCERLPFLAYSPNDDLILLHQFHVSETYALHCHEYYEVFYVIRGQAIHEVNGVSEVIGEGTLVFLRHDDEHCYKYFNLPDFEFININIETGLALDAFRWLRIPLEQIDSPVMPPSIRLSGAQHMEMRRKFLALSDMTPGPLRRRAFCALLPEILQLLCERPDQNNGQYIPRWLTDVLKRMEQPECFTAGLPALLRMTPYTQEHLTRSFRKFMHMSPTEYINQKRLSYAAELLTTEKLSPQQAAARAGFNNISHFYHLFRLQYSCTPLQFSQQYHDLQTGQARCLMRISRRAMHSCMSSAANRVSLEGGLFAYYMQDGLAQIYISFSQDATERNLSELNACWDPRISLGATLHVNSSNTDLLSHICDKCHCQPLRQILEFSLPHEALSSIPAPDPAHLRPYTPVLAPQLLTLLAAAAPEIAQQPAYDLIAHWNACTERGCVLVYFEDGAPVGMAWGIGEEIEAIVVDPAHRRRGIGTQLANQAARFLLTSSEAGVLYLDDTRSDALAFIRAAGFVKTAQETVFAL